MKYIELPKGWYVLNKDLNKGQRVFLSEYIKMYSLNKPVYSVDATGYYYGISESGRGKYMISDELLDTDRKYTYSEFYDLVTSTNNNYEIY